MRCGIDGPHKSTKTLHWDRQYSAVLGICPAGVAEAPEDAGLVHCHIGDHEAILPGKVDGLVEGAEVSLSRRAAVVAQAVR